MQAVKVNGEAWKDFDPDREFVNIPASAYTRIDLEVSYESDKPPGARARKTKHSN
jgi:hypothetical protein